MILIDGHSYGRRKTDGRGARQGRKATGIVRVKGEEA